MNDETLAAGTGTRLGGAAGPSTYRDLFLISFVILFFELACIRWFGSMVVFLTFFTNVVLLATFLGMSVGCLTASGRRDWSVLVVPLFLDAAAAAYLVLGAYDRLGRVMIDVGGQGSPQQIYFGTEYRATDPSVFVVPIELVAIVFFVLITLIFIGMGQVMGRAFNQAPDRLKAYTANIGGSLAGIAAFSAASYLRTTPLAWFAIVFVVWLYFLKQWTPRQIYGIVATLCLVGMTGYSSTWWAPYEKSPDYNIQLWSPYYKIQFNPAVGLINTNNIGHQAMVRGAESIPMYALPHVLNRDSGGKPFQDVLVIGAGSGNDVSAALRWGAAHIDAVEIDPAIYELGRANHPDAPYDDPRVSIHIDDGRSFIRKTDRKYDLVVYALVDSLVLQSGYSSLRLESFLFTKQAFDDIHARLKPGGMFAVYNLMRRGWLVGRIDKMTQESFGARPLVLSLPYVATISPSDPQTNRVTLFLSGSDSSPLAAIRKRFVDQQNFWLNRRSSVSSTINGFSPQPPASTGSAAADWLRLAPATVDASGSRRVPSDDWPFLYLRDPMIPALNVREMILLGAVSLAILLIFSPVKRVRPNGQMFFLGAGFMLLETKGVVHVALLFGSTWIVNSVVFFAVLLMILGSNFYVRLVRPKVSWPYYTLLVLALAANIAVPMGTFLALPGWQKLAVSCTVVFVPIFFAGIAFSIAFRDSRNPDVDFGSNIAGAVLGGLCENFSLILGFNYLLAIAIGFYLLSAVLGRRGLPVPAVADGG
jgi:SAM-dependent methyltransferase